MDDATLHGCIPVIIMVGLLIIEQVADLLPAADALLLVARSKQLHDSHAALLGCTGVKVGLRFGRRCFLAGMLRPPKL